MSDRWTDRLSEYVDGDLDARERAALEEHLADCAECRALVDELRTVAARARALVDAAPERDLWPAIAPRLESGTVVADLGERRGRERRRIAFSVPQLAAAAAALVVVSAGAVWLTLRPPSQASGPTSLADAGPAPAPAVAALAQTGYDATVAELQRVVTEHRDALDPVTVRVLEENLATIDSALAEIRRALASDPADRYLNAHLAQTMLRKVYVLRRAATLVEAAS
jgi:anti-sigma factor RsiW